MAFVGFWIVCVLMALTAVPLARWRHRRAPPLERAAACRRWVQRGFVFLHDYMRWCGLLHFDPRTVRLDVPGGGFVMVANHPTLVDVAALTAVCGRLGCIAKTLLFRTPILGGILRSCVYLDGGSGEAMAGALVVRQAVEQVQHGVPVLVFPEGTRSPAGGLHRFKRGAFEIACRARMPVVPVLIRCDPPALGKGRPWYDIPDETAMFTVTPLAPMRPDEYGGSPAAMATACEEIFRRQLRLPAAQQLETRS